jgi:nicotinamide-nucleotide amidase
MNAEIITIGDEILLGQIVDSNSAWIGQQLNLLNIRVRQITSIADKVQDITQSLSLASSRAELIIVTGGLGPTKDDVTRQTISTYFNKPLVRDAAVLKHVETLFKRFAPDRMMPEINKAQADVLDGCEVLFNDVGTAPGMWIEHQQIKYVFLPGVPFEMKFLTTNRILPKLRDGQREAVAHRHIITIGLGESFLAREITDIEESLPESIKLAFLPKLGLVRLRLTQIGESESSIDYFHNLLVERLGRHVVSTSDISFELAIV